MINMKYMTKNIKFNTSMLKQSLFNYSDAYILVKGTITVVRQGYIKVFSSKKLEKSFFQYCNLSSIKRDIIILTS